MYFTGEILSFKSLRGQRGIRPGGIFYSKSDTMRAHTNKFEKGMKVKCSTNDFPITPSQPEEYHDITFPKKGVIYTIRSVVYTRYGVGIRLEEIKNPEIHHSDVGFSEPTFSTIKFRICWGLSKLGTK